MDRTAILYIAERCNQQCVFCLEEDGGWNEFVDPNTQQVFDLVQRLRDRGAEHITFMGGETFFRKDLPRIVARAKEIGFTRIGVTTNGTVLSKKGFVGSLMRAGLDFIEMSIHGHTPELANAISRSGITFERQARALAETEAERLFTIVNVVVCHENKDHLVDVARYVLDGFPNLPVRFKLKFVSLQGWAAERAGSGERPLRYEDVDFERVGDFLADRGADFWFYNVPLCRLGRHAHHAHELSTIAADGQYFDFDHRSADEYYDSGNQLEGRVWPAESCGACTFSPICPGLEEQHRLANGASALRPRSDDPEPLVRFALEHAGRDPAIAKARLSALRLAPRPSRFVRGRADGALRFIHPDEREPFDLLVEPLREDRPAFHKTARFSLGYRARSAADRDPPPHVMALLEVARAALVAAEASGASLEQASAAIVRSAPSPWAPELTAAPAPERRKKWQLPVLKVAQ